MPHAPPQAPCSLADRLAGITDGLRRALAARGTGERVVGALVFLLWRRLSRLAVRFAALLARFHAGTLPPPRRRPVAAANPGTVATPAAAAATAPPPPRLPSDRGWLIHRMRETVVYGEYLRRLLAEPEMAALLEAAPQAARLLRPLWRMLTTEPLPALLRRPPPIRPPAPALAPARSVRRRAARSWPPPDRPRAAPRPLLSAPSQAGTDTALPEPLGKPA